MVTSRMVRRCCAATGAAVVLGTLSGCGTATANQSVQASTDSSGSGRVPGESGNRGAVGNGVIPRQLGIAVARFGDEAGVVAFVLLRNRASSVTAERVAGAFKAVLNRPVTVEALSGPGQIHGFMVQVAGLIFAVHCSQMPYVAPAGLAQFADQFADPETRERVATHKCFVSIDLMDVAPETLRDAVPIVARISAAFVDDGTTAVFSTFFHSAVPATPNTVMDFQSGNILGLLACAAEDDQRRNINAERDVRRGEIAEARRRVPEFFSAWSASGGKGTFLIKSAFVENDVTEHMWSKVISIVNGKVVATLANQPRYLKTVREGQKHSVLIEELSDWCYACNGKGAGGFTDPVMRQAFKGD